jgi:hypothetical protein
MARPQKKNPVAPNLTGQEAHNTLMLLNRVQTTGIQEAMVLGLIAQKLEKIKATDPTVGKTDGEDAPSTD